MLWGQNIKVYTDHANITRDLILDRVDQWRLLLEKYGPKTVYIKGINNTLEGRGGSKAVTHGQSVLTSYGRMVLVCYK
jgi:hypothetical protein